MKEFIYFGADPEFFLKKDGKIVPAHVVGVPHKGKAKGDKTFGYLYRDGYGLELAPLYHFCREILGSRVGMLLNLAKTAYPGTTFSTLPRVAADIEAIAAGPEDVQMFGCEPAFSAYHEGTPIEVSISALVHPYRYSGGHLHFGLGTVHNPLNYGKIDKPGQRCSSDCCWEREPTREKGKNDQLAEMIRKGNLEEARAFISPLVQDLDLSIGLLTTALFGDKLEAARRKHYGMAGEFRLQLYNATEYGLEYRVPSSRAFMHNASYSLHAGVGRAIVLNWLRGHRHLPSKGEAREIINHGDREAALKLFLSSSEMLDLVWKDETLGGVRERSLLSLRDTLQAQEETVDVDSYNLSQGKLGFEYWWNNRKNAHVVVEKRAA